MRYSGLSRLLPNRAAHLIARCVVDGHIMFFAAMLLDFWHDFLFAVSAHLPVTVLGTYVGALEIQLALALLRISGSIGIHIFLHPHMLFIIQSCINTVFARLTQHAATITTVFPVPI